MCEVETYTVCDGWTNTWMSDGEPETFDTPMAAFTALAEFFDVLTDEGMVHDYNPEGYRVVKIAKTT